MSNENTNGRSKLPDYYVQLAQDGKHGKEQLTDVGALWSGKNGYITGNTIAGRIVLQPRAARDELRRQRADRSHGNNGAMSQEIKPKQ